MLDSDAHASLARTGTWHLSLGPRSPVAGLQSPGARQMPEARGKKRAGTQPSPHPPPRPQAKSYVQFVREAGELLLPGSQIDSPRGFHDSHIEEMTNLHFERLGALLDHPASRALLEVAENRPCHVVGGAVRDALLGREWRDLDLLVAGGGDALARRLATHMRGRLVDLGRGEWAAWRIVVDGRNYDLWDRGDQSLAVELHRRDFTINALALSIPDGELIDPCGGLEDLRAGRLALPAVTSFQSDPLRVLRLVRHQTELEGFEIVPEALSLARRSAPDIGNVAPERVRDECDRVLAGLRPWVAAEPLADTDLYPRLWNGRGQVSTPAPYGATVERCKRMPQIRVRFGQCEPPGTLPPSAAGLAVDALLTAELEDPRASLAYLERHGYRIRRWLARLEHVLAWRRIPMAESQQRRFLHQLGEDWQAALLASGVRADTAAERAAWEARCRALCRLVEQAGAVIFDPPTLLDARAVMELLQIGPGPALGAALEAIRKAQVLGTVTTAGEAMELLRRHWTEENRPPD